MESNLAESFYQFINKVPFRKWWQFIRYLGLPENDIDEIFYDDDDPSEQKYQMLSRWKNYYGYKKPDQEIVSVLELAFIEITQNDPPDKLNRSLPEHLLPNRLIAKVFYKTMERIEGRHRRQFSVVKLHLSDTEINSIVADYPKDVDEQCYQMFLSWKRKTRMHTYQDIRDAIEKFVEEFLQQNQPGPAMNPPAENRVQQASWDTPEDMGPQRPPAPMRAPTDDCAGRLSDR